MNIGRKGKRSELWVESLSVPIKVKKVAHGRMNQREIEGSIRREPMYVESR